MIKNHDGFSTLVLFIYTMKYECENNTNSKLFNLQQNLIFLISTIRKYKVKIGKIEELLGMLG